MKKPCTACRQMLTPTAADTIPPHTNPPMLPQPPAGITIPVAHAVQCAAAGGAFAPVEPDGSVIFLGATAADVAKEKAEVAAQRAAALAAVRSPSSSPQ